MDVKEVRDTRGRIQPSSRGGHTYESSPDKSNAHRRSEYHMLLETSPSVPADELVNFKALRPSVPHHNTTVRRPGGPVAEAVQRLGRGRPTSCAAKDRRRLSRESRGLSNDIGDRASEVGTVTRARCRSLERSSLSRVSQTRATGDSVRPTLLRLREGEREYSPTRSSCSLVSVRLPSYSLFVSGSIAEAYCAARASAPAV
ncbi:hypothetical protein EVAR_53154_1 [Eumeta japonica]|uniref:Uncharacterized protein n=1 Tax=Eumeta variegata TaxID=151549 RepID=A0A4C1YFB9_EUMVA|nr:hypothetical protein EVAR_53154_1 [Eumeta japonica]